MIEITIAQAINVLEQAVNVGASKGSYLIKEATTIDKALEYIKEYVKAKGDEVNIPKTINE